MFATTAQQHQQPLCLEHFQIAIICALDVERDAVEATMVLDRRTFKKAYGDRNQYTLGVICEKPVVLVCLENMGPLDAMDCARDMALTFHHIAYALIVGCAGGVPYLPDGAGWRRSDIHLGDVIISTQVIQYDQGSQLENELRRKTDVEDVLRKAPRGVRNIVNLLKTGKSDLFESIQSKTATPLNELPKENKLRTIAYEPPGKDTDLVFAQDYRHKHRDPSVCDICSACTHWSHNVCEEALHTHCRDLGCVPAFSRGETLSHGDAKANTSNIPQPDRPTKIHVGRIASGGAVMKSAHTRDRIVRQDGVIGFEMEGAGVWEVFGTIVIKGIVDYADSHKNKDWRLYPMARAALCAAALIEAIQLEDQPHRQMPRSSVFPVTTSHLADISPFDNRAVRVQNTGSESQSDTIETRWIVGRIPTPVFAGYTQIINRLQDRLLAPEAQNERDHRVTFVLAGMGGVGKSETVLQFLDINARRLRQSLWGVFWIDCSSETSALSSLKLIGERCGWPLGDPSTLYNVVSRLSSSAGRSLLVLDNCDDAKFDYSQYMPSGPHIDIIITTRITAFEDWYASQGSRTEPRDYLHLSGLDRESAVDLLLNKSNKTAEDTHASAAYRLAELLDYHPLALTVAGSLIRSGVYSIPGFADEFEAQTTQEDLLTTESIRSPYRRISATFDISAQSLQRDATTDPIAADALAVFGVFAFFDRTNITESMFTRSWAFESQVLSRQDDNDITKLSSWHVTQCRAMLYSADTSRRVKAFRKACALLDRLSLIQGSADTSISLHPLVHTWARQRVEQKHAVWSRAASILALSTENSEEWQPFTLQLQRHMEANFGYSLDLCQHEDDADTVEADDDLVQHCKILYLYGCQLYRAHNVHTTKVCENLVARTEAVFPDATNLDQVLEARFLLAIGYQRNPHQVAQAVEMFERILEMQSGVDEDDPARLNFEHGLALAYLKSKQFSRALTLASHVVSVRRRTLPETSANRCSTEHILARAHLGVDQIDQAIEILEHIVRVEDRLPEDDHRRLASQYELAAACLDDGQVERAGQLLERVVGVWRKSVEESHADRLKAEHDLARAHYESGNLDQAISLLRHVVDVRSTTLPAEDEQRKLSEDKLETYLREREKATATQPAKEKNGRELFDEVAEETPRKRPRREEK